MKRFVGIEIGGTKLQLVSGDENGHIHRGIHFTVNKEAGAAGIRDDIERTLISWKDLHHDGIVVGFGGPVDIHSNSICTSYHISGWSGFSLAGWLHQISGVPVILENDANTAALGEAIYGAGRDDRIVFYVTLGSGTGGGLVIDKKIFHGSVKGESEFGHLRLDKSGRILESSCSGWAVDKKIREAALKYPDSMLANLVKDVSSGEAKVLAQALQDNDLHAWQIFNDTVDDLVFGLSHVVHLFHPGIIILGGGLSLMGEILRQAVQDRLTPLLMDNFQPGPSVRLAQLKEDAVPVGCMAIASQKFKTPKSLDMKQYVKDYVLKQQQTLSSLPVEKVNEVIAVFKRALDEGRQIFVFGNGGSAANASHFVTDLGKGSSDKTYKRFRCVALNDNTSWMTALGNDYAYDEIFVRQLMNLAMPGDIVLTMSVSGNSPNLIKAMKWSAENGLFSIALVGNTPSKLDEMADLVIKVADTHYGRVEDVHMNICHMICFAFMEEPLLQTA